MRIISDCKIKLKDYIKIEINGGGIKRIINLLFNPSYNSVFLIRAFLCSNNSILKKVIFRKLIRYYGIFIGDKTEIGLGLTLGHPNGIIFGEGVRLGENCTIFQQVTFGVKNIGDEVDIKYPVVGNNCVFGAGAKVLGNIYVADGTKVGANSVLLKSTIKNGVYAGCPALKISDRTID